MIEQSAGKEALEKFQQAQATGTVNVLQMTLDGARKRS
jgi:hypothetical protein